MPDIEAIRGYIYLLWSFWEPVLTRMAESLLTENHRQLHDRAHGSSKIRNSVDNNLLLKIRFRQKSITFSAVDINRKI